MWTEHCECSLSAKEHNAAKIVLVNQHGANAPRCTRYVSLKWTSIAKRSGYSKMYCVSSFHNANIGVLYVGIYSTKVFFLGSRTYHI